MTAAHSVRASAAPALPATRLILGPRRQGSSVALATLVHALAVVALLGRAGVPERAAGPAGTRGGGGGGGTSRPVVNFFTLPAAGAPLTIAVPVPPRIALADLPRLPQIPLELPKLQLPHDTVPRTALAVPGVSTAGGMGVGPGAGGGRGTGVGAGSDAGPGTLGTDGYIFVASPRTAVLPPLAKVPGSVAGRTYRIRFWVAADGQVTHVEVDPPMNDAGYSREFLERMMAYQFYPARTRDGQNVASVVTVPLRIGN